MPERSNTMSRRDLLRRGAFAGGAALLGPTFLAACGTGDEDTLARAQEEGFIRIGFANEAPYGFADEAGNPTGQAPEVAKAVLAELGIDDIAGVVTEFGSLIPGLNAGRYDLVAAGMFINPERCSEVLFSDPDYCAPQAFAVQEGNPEGLTDYQSVADNPDVRLGVLAGAVEQGYAEDSGVSSDQISTFDTDSALLDALLGDRIDAFALTSITVRRLVGDRSGVEMVEPFVPVIDGEEELGCGGYAFRAGDADFRDEFNRVLLEMQEAGELLPIVEEFGFGQEELDAAVDKSADELCEGESP